MKADFDVSKFSSEDQEALQRARYLRAIAGLAVSTLIIVGITISSGTGERAPVDVSAAQMQVFPAKLEPAAESTPVKNEIGDVDEGLKSLMGVMAHG